MRVESSSRAQRTTRTTRAGSAAATRAPAFVLAGQAGPEASSRLTGGVPLTSLTDLLAIQADDEGTARRRMARERGDTMLARLDEIRLALLNGQLGPETLVRLKVALSSGWTETDDPALNAVLAEIELRAEVEIAKLEQFGRRQGG